MPKITHQDTPMHRIRLYVPCEDTPDLLENVYETYTVRDYYLWGIPVWSQERDVTRGDMNDFIRRACGG